MNKRPQDGLQGPQNAAQGQAWGNNALLPSASYKAIYRAVYEYHERHGPCPTDPGGWHAAAADFARIAAAGRGNPFLTSLLLAVYEEMERQYKTEILKRTKGEQWGMVTQSMDEARKNQDNGGEK